MFFTYASRRFAWNLQSERVAQGVLSTRIPYQRKLELQGPYQLYQLNSISNLKPWKRKNERNFGEEWIVDLWDELNKYCHSDVMVLKAACFKFIQEFNAEAGFNHMEKCATIASACNLFWRQELIPEDTIAIEPLNGWRGNQVNQSKVALEWLCYEDFKHLEEIDYTT